MKHNETKAYGSIRKTRAYGACGVLLGLAALTLIPTTRVHADETLVETTPEVTVTTTANPATNMEEAQAEPSTEQVELAQNAGTQTGEMVEEVTSESLKETVSEAEEAGVSVSKEEAVIHDSLEKAKEDLAKQEEKVTEAKAKQEANTQAIEKATEINAQVEAENKAEEERVKKVNEEGQAAVDERNREAQAAIEASNQAAQAEADKINAERQAEYEAALKELKDTQSYNEEVRKRNEAAQAAVDQKNKQAQAEYQQKLEAAKAQLNTEGSLSELVTNELVYKREPNVDRVTITGQYKNISASADAVNKIVLWSYEAEHYLNNPATLSSVVEERRSLGTSYGGFEDASYWVIARAGETVTVTYEGLDNSSFDGRKITKVVYEYTALKTEENKPYVVMQIMKDPTRGIKYGSASASTVAALIRKEISGDSELYSKRMSLAVRYYDEAGNVISLDEGKAYVAAGSRNGAEGKGEYFKILSDGRFIPVTGSSIGLTDGNVAIALDGQDKFERSEWDVTDSGKEWYGAAVFEVEGSQLQFEFGSIGAGLQEWFTFSSELFASGEVPSPPKPEVFTAEPETPLPETPVTVEYVTPTLETFVPETYTPITPTVKPYVPVPKKETYVASVHPVFVKQTPTNIKSVANEDGEDTDGRLVPKGSTQVWTLTNAPLQAGRQTVTSYTMTDPVPVGFKLDLEATQAKNTDWLVSVDEVGQVQFVATEATLALFNADTTKDSSVPLAYLVGSPQNDGGTYENTFETTITTPNGSYKVVSNTPVIYTPGNDPETPRRTRDGEDPTPDDNLIQPKKDVVDEKGKSIDGTSILPNTTLTYVAEQDFDQYKGMTASEASIKKGFLYVDDYLDEAIDGQSLVVNGITASNGDDVRELLDMYHVLSAETLDEKLNALIKDSGISPVGEFYLWVAKDPEAFYKAYVQKGLDITYNLSFKLKTEFTEGDITNQTFQIDFSNGYYGNIVKNTLPPLVVHKEVLDTNGKSIDNGTVKLGDTVTYKLEGWVIPAGRGYDIHNYIFVDLLQNSHDEYETFKVEAKVDILLSDGSIIQAGEDISRLIETTYDPETGRLEAHFKEDFLSQITRDSAFGADGYVVVKRIAAGEVVNEYTLIVNDNEVLSNKVKTTTPEPEKPKKPVEPAKPALPKTGSSTGKSLSIAGVGTLVLYLSTFLGFRNKKEEN